MKRQLISLIMIAAIFMALTSCGAESTTDDEAVEEQWPAKEWPETEGEPYNAGASGASLQEAGWEPSEVEAGITYAEDVQEVGYLTAVAPEGEVVDLQFLATPEEAQSELEATQEQMDPFGGTVIGNVLVFVPGDEETEVSEETLQELQELLR